MESVFLAYLWEENSVLSLETLSGFCKTSLQSISFFDNKQACHQSYSKSEIRKTKSLPKSTYFSAYVLRWEWGNL